MSSFVSRALLAGIAAAIAWGALAFGGAYPWAYVPLGLGCGAVGLAGVVAGAARRPPVSRLACGFVAIGAAVSMQLVPLPRPVLTKISPGTDAFNRQFDFSYEHPAPLALSAQSDDPDVQELSWRPVSIAPEKTVLGLALFAAFALFLLGSARVVSAIGARQVGTVVLSLGILLTLLAMIQLALNPDPSQYTLIYGFWRPRGVSTPFGPFVNPNHYAGWMLMGLPLVLGLGYGLLERVQSSSAFVSMRRLSWTSSKEGGTVVLAAFACLAMAVSLVMTKSRSGVVGLAVATVLAGTMVFRRQREAHARAIVAGTFALLFLGSIAWAGVDALTIKFQAPDGGIVGLAGRVGAWKDAVSIVRRSPWTGTGLNTFGTGMMVFQSFQHTIHFQEAHNDYLQLAAEGGILVGVPVLFTLAVFVIEVRRRFREAPREGLTYWLRVGAVVGLIAIALQSLVEFSLQMPGNAALFAVLAAIALHRSPHLRLAPHRPAALL